MLRTEHPLTPTIKRKVALFCNVLPEAVIESRDMPTIYEVPLRMREQRLDEVVLSVWAPVEGDVDLTAWSDFVDQDKAPEIQNRHCSGG